MDIDKVFQDQLIKITQEAAVSVYPHLGKNNKVIADYCERIFDREAIQDSLTEPEKELI